MNTQSRSLRLFVDRHAKSSWKDDSLQDHDRPLNKRGKDNAPRMGKYLKHLPIPKIDLLLSSSAKRAVDTATLLALSLQPGRIEQNTDLYMSDLPTLLSILQQIPHKHDATVMLIGHNPELTDLANHITATKDITTPIINVPTCAVLDITIQATKWKNLRYKDMQLQGFYCPKLCLDR